MELLFRREQSSGGVLFPVVFRLWSKVELSEEEQALVERYRLNDAVLIASEQEHLVRHATIAGAGALAVVSLMLYAVLGLGSFLVGLLAGLAFGFYYFHQKRETIRVKDLLHGRFFRCHSIVDLARKEAHLSGTVSYLRQVIESAKHWDGTERLEIAPLPPEEAKRAIL